MHFNDSDIVPRCITSMENNLADINNEKLEDVDSPISINDLPISIEQENSNPWQSLVSNAFMNSFFENPGICSSSSGKKPTSDQNSFPRDFDSTPFRGSPLGREHECTDDVLREVGYIRQVEPPSQAPKHPIPDKQTYTDNKSIDFKRLIKIRCLQPPPIPPPGKLTIVETRPPEPRAPPAKHIWVVRRAPTPPPLILREQPPKPPPVRPAETCHVTLPTPPPPPQQIITHICQCPPKPRDIIIERWLPYKPSGPREKIVIPALPYIPKVVRDIEITHVPAEVHITHHIEHQPGPIPTNPYTYAQEYGNTLLDMKAIQNRLRQELTATRASQDIFTRFQAIFQVPCDQMI